MENQATSFVKEHFNWDGMYLMYQPNGFTESESGYRYLSNTDMKFIARFKYGSKPWKTWVNFMVKNFTQEEYFKLEKESSPLAAMESKGWFHPSALIKREMKTRGYPATKAGQIQMIKDDIVARNAL